MNLDQFFRFDRRKPLFPLDSPSILHAAGEREIREYVYNSLFNSAHPHSGFLPGPVAFANKDQFHLRKVYVLDPVASFYLYDFVLRNCAAFQKPSESRRQFYGYSFDGDTPLNPFSEYHEFRRKKYALKQRYKYFLKVDISNCFSSFYHHDIVSHLSNIISVPESIQFGQYLRELGAGRTVDCLPQGYFPAKSIGNRLLAFSEQSRSLESNAIIRFVDDFFFFSDQLSTLEQDIRILQHVLSDLSLQLNQSKTKFGSSEEDFEERNLDPIKKRLLTKRERRKIAGYDEEDEEDVAEELKLTQEEQDYLIALLRQTGVQEEDVELALSLLSMDLDIFLVIVEAVFEKYPHLIKSLYHKINDVEDDGALWSALKKKTKDSHASEFELFWLVRIILDQYEFDEKSAALLHRVYEHSNATEVVRAVILETEENDFGLEELKRRTLRNTGASLEGIASAVGLRNTEKARRNHAYKYAARSGEQMALYIKILSKM